MHPACCWLYWHSPLQRHPAAEPWLVPSPAALQLSHAAAGCCCAHLANKAPDWQVVIVHLEVPVVPYSLHRTAAREAVVQGSSWAPCPDAVHLRKYGLVSADVAAVEGRNQTLLLGCSRHCWLLPLLLLPQPAGCWASVRACCILQLQMLHTTLSAAKTLPVFPNSCCRMAVAK